MSIVNETIANANAERANTPASGYMAQGFDNGTKMAATLIAAKQKAALIQMETQKMQNELQQKNQDAAIHYMDIYSKAKSNKVRSVIADQMDPIWQRAGLTLNKDNLQASASDEDLNDQIGKITQGAKNLNDPATRAQMSQSLMQAFGKEYDLPQTIDMTKKTLGMLGVHNQNQQIEARQSRLNQTQQEAHLNFIMKDPELSKQTNNINQLENTTKDIMMAPNSNTWSLNELQQRLRNSNVGNMKTSTGERLSDYIDNLTTKSASFNQHFGNKLNTLPKDGPEYNQILNEIKITLDAQKQNAMDRLNLISMPASSDLYDPSRNPKANEYKAALDQVKQGRADAFNYGNTPDYAKNAQLVRGLNNKFSDDKKGFQAIQGARKAGNSYDMLPQSAQQKITQEEYESLDDGQRAKKVPVLSPQEVNPPQPQVPADNGSDQTFGNVMQPDASETNTDTEEGE